MQDADPSATLGSNPDAPAYGSPLVATAIAFVGIVVGSCAATAVDLTPFQSATLRIVVAISAAGLSISFIGMFFARSIQSRPHKVISLSGIFAAAFLSYYAMVVLTEKKEDPTHTEVPPARNDSNSEQAPAPYRLAPTGTDLEDKSTPIAFGANGRTIAWGAADGSLNAWDLASGKLEATLKGANGPVHSVAFTADSRQVVSSYANGVVLQWDLKSGTAIDIKAQPGEPKSVVISPRGDRIVSFSGGTVELGSAETGKTLAATMLLRPGGETIRSVAFSPDGSRVVAAYSGGLMFVDAQSFRKTAEVHVGDDPITSVAFSPDDRQIAVGTATGPIVLLDAANQRQLRTIKGNGEPVASLAFMPNNDSLVWTSSTGSFSFVKLDGDVPR